MILKFLDDIFQNHGASTAIVWNNNAYTFSDLNNRIATWKSDLTKRGIKAGSAIALEGDFSPNSIALLLALIDHSAIIIPQSNVSHSGRERKDEISQVEAYYKVNTTDEVEFFDLNRTASHPLYDEIKSRAHPGLVLFSSGTSGDPKAAVHDFTTLLEKFATRRTALTTLNFLLFDHWGGLNTMFHTLSNAATIVTVQDRSPAAVCAIIEKFRVQLLPATPTFLNLLLLSGIYKEFDLSSLAVISYGAEPMPQSTLDRLKDVFPQIKLQQTYGLIEVGVLRSKSKDDGSLWVKVGGEGYETRIVDGILQIKTKSTILGYLNAPTPITEDGWFITGDAVEQDGEYLRILGRKSEMINVGGEKVYPAEVESVIQQMEEVVEATVYGEKNPLIGSIVCAKVRTSSDLSSEDLSQKVKSFCKERLEKFKVPVKVQIFNESHYGDRFKKIRKTLSSI